MKKIRIGNDFVFNWAIERGGLPENLESVLDAKLTASVFGKKQEVPFTVSGNIITIEFTPEICNVIGSYNLLFTYILPDTGLSDEDRKCAVDVDAFQIVARTAQADDPSEFTVTSDMAIAFKGDKGDSAYQVWLDAGNTGTEEDYFAYLRQPATDAAASVSALEQTVSDNEALRVTAEQGRVDAELLRVGAESARSDAEGLRNENEIDRIEAERIRNTNETGRINAESDRMDAEVLREQAEAAREEAEDLRQTNTTKAIQDAGEATTAANTAAGLATEAATTANTAAGDANDAATAANTAAGLADTARTELTTAVNTKLGEADDKIEEMDTTLSTYDGRVTQVESDIAQLAGDVSLLDAVHSDKIRDIENVISTMNPNQSAQVSVSGVSPLSLPKNAANGGMSVKLEGLTEDVGGVITHFEPTGRIRVEDVSENEVSRLYLTAPELRSNGTVKDKIRKGENGYELVKRVGSAILTPNYSNNFEATGVGTSLAGDEIHTWGVNTVSPISGIRDARLTITQAGTKATRPLVNVANSISVIANTWYRIKFKYKVNSGTVDLYRILLGNVGFWSSGAILSGTGEFTAFIKTLSAATTYLGININGTYICDVQFDDFTLEAVIAPDAISDTSTFTELSDGTILYTLATPEIIPISYGGVLNSAENGTVYHEPIIADAGVYGTNMPILLTDYPIASLEEIIIHKDGIDTYLDVSTAVIAPDGLSFTHPDLGSGDLVLFTYAFAKESTNGNITATFYDSNVVKIDTVTGKAYKIEDVVTNGVLTRTLTEV